MWLENGEGVTCERGKKKEQDNLIPCIIEDTGVSPEQLDRAQLGEVKSRPTPRIHSPPAEPYADYPDSQIPPWDDDYSDPDYPFEAYM